MVQLTRLAYCSPPSGGLGLLTALVVLVISLLAGQVGNMDSSMGKGDSWKYGCLSASSDVTLLEGLYVRNLLSLDKGIC